MVPFLRRGTLATSKVHPWNADCSKKTYQKFSNQVCAPIVKFLTGVDALGQPKEVHKAKEVQMLSATGQKVTGRNLITFAEDITEAEL